MAAVCLLAALGLLFQLLGGSAIIPDNFPIRNISLYTVRYLSENGSDTENCLSNQPYPPDAPVGSSQHCRSLLYALTGGLNFKSYDKSNLVVLLLPGSYSLGEYGIGIYNYSNIILSKLPDTHGEAVVSCDRHLEDDYNNLFVAEAVNFALNGLVFTGCGSYSTPVRLQNSANAVISNCTFRCVTY